MPDINDLEEFKVDLPEPVHTCKVFGPFKQGKVEQKDDCKPKFNEYPSIVDNFIGR